MNISDDPEFFHDGFLVDHIISFAYWIYWLSDETLLKVLELFLKMTKFSKKSLFLNFKISFKLPIYSMIFYLKMLVIYSNYLSKIIRFFRLPIKNLHSSKEKKSEIRKNLCGYLIVTEQSIRKSESIFCKMLLNSNWG